MTVFGNSFVPDGHDNQNIGDLHDAGPTPLTRRWRTAAILCFVLIAIFHGATLMRFPPPFVDEAWYIARAWEYVDTGRQFGMLDRGVLEQFARPWCVFPWLPTAMTSLALRLADAPSLHVMRWCSFAGGMLLLAALWGITRRLFNPQAAVLAVVLCALSFSFCYSAHLARTDVIAAAFGYTGILLYVAGGQRRFLPGLAGGGLIGLAVEIHPHSAIFALAIMALALFDLVVGSPRCSRGIAGIICGGFAGILFYLGIHVAPDPAAYFDLNTLIYTRTHVPPLLSFRYDTIARAFTDLNHGLFAMLFHSPLVTPVWIVAVAVTWKHLNKRMIVLLISFLAGHALLLSNKAVYYAIHTVPALAMCTGAIVAHAWLRPMQPQQTIRNATVRILAGVLLVSPILSHALRPLRLIYQVNFNAQYQEVQRQLNSVVGANESILGSQTWWLGMPQHTFYSWENLIYYDRLYNDASVADALTALQPDILIIDGHFRWFIRDDPGSNDYLRQMRIPESELMAFLDANASLITTLNGLCYGAVDVYRIQWRAAPE